MLRPQPKEKERRRVAVPGDLRDALGEALFLIEQSSRDSDVRVDYGDAIQAGCLVGGRVGSGQCPFEFTYYADGNRWGKSQWHLALHPLEIEDIVDGHMTEITLYCCRTPECGHKSNDKVFLCDCDYVDDPYFGNIHFPHATEALRRIGVTGISDSSTRDDVIRILGEPMESGGGEKHPGIGFIWPWIKYHRDDCQLRFEFQKSGKLKMVTIHEADWKPGK